jgi:glycosyltransferase involved in cell wall biosynthesis
VSLISLVLPCYNEASVLDALAERLGRVLPDIAREAGVGFELIFVDDGSRDATAPMLRERSFDWPARLLLLSRNFGKEAALTAGLDAARGDAVVFMDADLQHPPEAILQLIETWREGNDVVYFFKAHREEEGGGRGVIGRVFYWLINLGTRVRIPENAGDFRLLDRAVVDALRRLPERERFFKGLYAWVGFRQTGLPLAIPPREGDGGSRFSPFRLYELALDGLTSFTVAPIRLISLFGTTVSILSLLYLAWIVVERLLFGGPFSGFASIVVLVVFFGGMQLLCLGLIGEYVGKTLLEAKQRPTYILRDEVELGRARRTNAVELRKADATA